jgi:hypothetical protein
MGSRRGVGFLVVIGVLTPLQSPLWKTRKELRRPGRLGTLPKMLSMRLVLEAFTG